MTFPIPDNSFSSRYAQVHAAVRRARHFLYHGGEPLVRTTSRRPERIAVEEVLAGVCPYTLMNTSEPERRR